MKLLKSLMLLAVVFVIGCNPKTVLQTGSGEVIDLSGKWTKTDAEISAEQLFKELTSSAWLKSFVSKNNYRPTILVESFTNDFDDDLANDQLKNIMEQLISNSRQFELITSDDTSVPYFIMKGKLTSQSFEMNEESGINYQLTLRLFSTEGEKEWDGEETIKKFLNN